MKQKKIEELLDLYLKGKCTPDKKRKFEPWFDQISFVGEFEVNDKQAITQRLKDEIDLQTGEERFINLPAILKIAASIILITSISILGYYKSNGLRNWIDPVQYVLTTVLVGQKIKLTLKNEGSTVILNSGSTDSLEKILFAIAKTNNDLFH